METDNRWQPVTEEYQALVGDSFDAEGENQKTLRNLHLAAANKTRLQKKTPVGVVLIALLLFCRAGLYAALLIILAGLPRSDASAWLVGNMSHVLRLPHALVHVATVEAPVLLKKVGMNPASLTVLGGVDQNDLEAARRRQRLRMMGYPLFLALSSLFVAFLCSYRLTIVRWLVILYAGIIVLKAGADLVSGWPPGGATQCSTVESSLLLLAAVLNAFILYYFALWPGVRDWFRGAA